MIVVVAVTGEFVVAGIVVARVVALVAGTVFNVRSASTAMLTWASTAGVGPISGSSHLCHKTVGMVHLLLRITELVRTGIGPINGLAQTSLTCLRRISGPLLMDGIQVIGAGLQVLGMHPVTLQAPWPKWSNLCFVQYSSIWFFKKLRLLETTTGLSHRVWIFLKSKKEWANLVSWLRSYSSCNKQSFQSSGQYFSIRIGHSPTWKWPRSAYTLCWINTVCFT